MNELHDDDKPIGRLLTRREAILLLGGAGAAMIAGTGFNRFTLRQTTTPTATPVPACIVLPELTEGPYFVDEQLSLQMEVLKKGFNCESCFGYRT